MAITFKDFAKEVLTISDIPLTQQEIWDKGIEQKLEQKLKSFGIQKGSGCAKKA